MKNYLVAFGFGALAVVAVMGWTSDAAAIPPPGYNLYDANDVYLGQMLGVTHNDSGDISYITYHPDVNGILEFGSGIADGGVEPAFTTYINGVFYELPDCQGVAYISPDYQHQYRRPWIVRSQFNEGLYKVVGSTTIAIEPASYSEGMSCGNFQGPPGIHELYKLNPVTLPFDVDAVRPPYKIRD